MMSAGVVFSAVFLRPRLTRPQDLSTFLKNIAIYDRPLILKVFKSRSVTFVTVSLFFFAYQRHTKILPELR